MFLHFKQEKPTTTSTAPFSQAPGTVSEALPGNQKASSGLIHVPPTSEQGQVLMSDPPEDTLPSPSALKGKAGALSMSFVGEETQSLLLRHPYTRPH